MAKVELLKDANGNLWDYIGYDEEIEMHQVEVIDCDEGIYTRTAITCFMSDDEYKATTKVIIDC